MRNPPRGEARRSFLSRVGTGATALGALLTADPARAAAQAGASARGSRFQRARHAQDDWLGALPGTHRFVFDATTPRGFGEALLYANNFFVANHDAYQLADSDAAVVIVARHTATPFAYTDAVWGKYAAQIGQLLDFIDPKTKQRPTTNLYNSDAYGTALPNFGTTIETLVKRGVVFAVCQMATRFFAMNFAGGSGNADAIYSELASNLVPNSRLVAAGIVAVNRAQERGYTLATVG